ncbi:uncharacterized protein MONOS_7385 [Monocercomonoides exilis]|uniref:uncharacterized protein n=1 Tax=Monocercomonoides exilis TaxID=2049356 RepID=UPI003559DF23|nr:hypothetical protein MONOS_7385 [Monocercomonoides exilis]|eukprot:MONOS_7385.1-p1 / transcript=MONOS_7385.1 / gene=MONOS_7385 / organism=Monocercomonoides_exilis_PA203 / gene_product=unspecified product / transcript_product=unspecified product / location=Mono_scaffold00251:11390-12520(+) / protein_length=316 / sequence_SO=supercontig / SO=protein_coding / is_pseudo=false
MGIYELIDTVFRLTHGYVGFHLNIIELPGDEQTVLSPRVAAIAPLEHIQEYSFPVVAFPLSHEIRSFGYILDLPLSLCENPLVHSTMEGKYHRLLICGDNGVGFGREAGSYKPIGDKLSSSSLLQTISCADGACASSSATPSSSMPVSSSSAEVKCSIHNIKRDEEHPHKIRPQISQIVYPECLSSLKIPDSMLCLPPSPAPTAEYGYQPPLFAGDRGDWERIVRMCTPVDTLLHEATHSVTKLKVPERMGHSSSVIAAQRANEIKAKRLIITHFPRTTQFSEGGIEMLAQEARSALNSSAELIVAEDGLTINLF